VKSVVWEPAAVRDMKRLDPHIARQVRDHVNRFAASGRGDVKRLGAAEGVCRLRSGDWRIRFRVEPGDTLRILSVRHRSEAYR
jgi:mRNA interferase RelE/StbE